MANKYGIRQVILISLGLFSFFLGFIGVFIPVFPTSPFLIVSYVCFSKGSTKFHNWFLSTELYKKYIQHFIETKTLTIKQKLFITVPLTISLIGSGFIVKQLIYSFIILLVLMSIYLFFFFYIKTYVPENTPEKEKNHSIVQKNSQGSS